MYVKKALKEKLTREKRPKVVPKRKIEETVVKKHVEYQQQKLTLLLKRQYYHLTHQYNSFIFLHTLAHSVK